MHRVCNHQPAPCSETVDRQASLTGTISGRQELVKHDFTRGLGERNDWHIAEPWDLSSQASSRLVYERVKSLSVMNCRLSTHDGNFFGAPLAFK